MTEKEKRVTEADIVNHAVSQAINYLRETSGLDMSAQQFAGYLDKQRLDFEINKIKESEEFRKVRDDKKAQFFYEGIRNYIVKFRPFNEQGQKLLEGNLESIVGKDETWTWAFTRKGREEKREKRRAKTIDEYLKSKGVAEKIYQAVANDPRGYAEDAPELSEAVRQSKGYSRAGEIADIFYAEDILPREKYSEIKSIIKDSSRKIIELGRRHLEDSVKKAKEYARRAGEYIARPAAGYATAAIGFILILLFSPILPTGNVIGTGKLGNNSILPFLGIGLLFVSGLSFIFQGRKLKK